MQSLQKQQYIMISGNTTLIRKRDGRIKIKQVNSLVRSGAVEGTFWGILIGLTFFMPWVGMPAGAGTGTQAGKLTDYGISDSFIKEVGATIRPGNSALFMMVDRMTDDRIIEVLSQHKATLLRTNLSEDDELKLHEAFGAAEMEI
jgi:uncharacterized membrane protein